MAVSVQAVAGSVGGVLADPWKDFHTVPDGLPATAALFAAVPRGTNAGRGSNTKGSTNIVTNGSKIVVPEGGDAGDVAVLEQQQSGPCREPPTGEVSDGGQAFP